jgi:hypothetical protein
VHIIDRCRAFVGGKANSDILEGGLILVVLVTIASVGPAVWSRNAELVRSETIQLMLAAVATALCLVERKYDRPTETEMPEAITEPAATPRAAPWFSPFR